MPVITAHVVKKPRKHWRCNDCRDRIDGAHVVAFGYTVRGDTPYRIRVCMDCASSNVMHDRERWTHDGSVVFLVATKFIGAQRSVMR